MGILYIIDGVLAVLPDGQTQVEFHLRVGLGVKIPAGSVHADLVQQIVEGDGLAGTLRHPDHLAVPQQLHQLHEHDIQPLGAIKAQRVQCALQAGHMAVMVGAPDVDDLVEAADGELVAVIGDVRSEAEADARIVPAVA